MPTRKHRPVLLLSQESGRRGGLLGYLPNVWLELVIDVMHVVRRVGGRLQGNRTRD